MAETLGASFSIDTTNLKAGLTQANRLIRESQSEFKAAAAGMDDWSKSEDGLNAKIASLNTITDLQKQKVNALQSEYDDLISKGLDPTSAQAVLLNTRINNETAALKENEAELKKQTQALKDLENGTEEAADATEEATSKFDGLKAIGGAVVGAVAAVGAACVAAVGSFFALAESTREARENMAKLETGFTTAGHSAEDATKTYITLYGVLGDDGQATEAAAHLAQLTDNQKDLATWTDIATGVYATFGDSLPIENLTEAANETAKTGAITGGLADALNWAGVSEDNFQASLDACSTEQERQALITETLNGLYSEAAEKYKEVNADVIAAQEAQANLNNTLNELGAIAEPIMTTLKTVATDLLQSITPFVALIGEGLAGALNGADGAADTLAEGLSGLITSLLDKVIEIVPVVIDTVLALFPKLLSSILEQVPSIIQTLLTMVTSCITALGEMLPSIIPTIIDAVILVAETLLDNVDMIIDAGIKLLIGLADGLIEALPRLIEKVPTIIEKLLTAITNNLPKLLQTGVTLLVELTNGIIGALPTLVESVPQIISTIVTTLTENLPQILSMAVTLVTELANGIIGALPTLVESVPQIISTIVTTITNNLPQILSMAVTLVTELASGIVDALPKLAKQVPKIISTIVDTIKDKLPKIISAAGNLVGKLASGIVDALPKLAKKVPKIISTIVDTIKDKLPKIISAAGTLVGKLASGIVDALPKLAKKVPKIITTIIDTIKDKFPKIISTAGTLVGKLAKGIGDALPKLVTSGVNLVTNLVKGLTNSISKIKDTAPKLISSLTTGLKNGLSSITTVGKDLITGLWNGINNMASWIKSKIQGFGSGVLNNLKSFFGIHSPSTVMEKQVGKNIALGIASGIDKTQSKVTSSLTTLSNKMLKAAKSNKGEFEKTGEEAIESFSSGIEKRKTSVIDAVTQTVNAAIAEASKSNEKNEAAYEKLGENIIESFANGISQAADEAITEVNETLSKITKATQEQYDEIIDKQNSLQNKMSGFGDLFLFDDETGDVSLANLEKQNKKLKKYAEGLEWLKGNVSDELYEEVESLGVEEGVKVLAHLQDIGSDELIEFEKQFEKRNKIAKDMAKTIYADDIDNIKTEYVDKVNDAFKTLETSLETIGADALKGFVNGLSEENKKSTKEIQAVTKSIVDAIKSELKIKSPSRVMADEVGKNLALGIGLGFKNNIGAVNDEITSAMNFESKRNNGGNGGGVGIGGVTVYQTNNYAQAHSRYELYKSKQQTAAAVRLALQGA